MNSQIQKEEQVALEAPACERSYREGRGSMKVEIFEILDEAKLLTGFGDDETIDAVVWHIRRKVEKL